MRVRGLHKKQKMSHNYFNKEPDPSLFDTGADWMAEWKGMPEFEQGKQEEFAKIIIRFRNQKDVDDFAKLIGQKLTRLTKSTWHPAFARSSGTKRAYENET